MIRWTPSFHRRGDPLPAADDIVRTGGPNGLLFAVNGNPDAYIFDQSPVDLDEMR